MIQKSVSLKYEPSAEQLLNSAKWLTPNTKQAALKAVVYVPAPNTNYLSNPTSETFKIKVRAPVPLKGGRDFPKRCSRLPKW